MSWRTSVAAVLAVQVATTLLIVRQAHLRHHTLSKHSIRVKSATSPPGPVQLTGAFFNVSLGCWHVRADSRGSQSFHVAAEVNFEPGDRWQEMLTAIYKTHSSNPGVHYILVTQKISMLELATASLVDVPHDLWFCPEVLYGTPIRIGNTYAGPKITASIDNWLPPLKWQCTFTTGAQPIVYVVQRKDTKEFSGKDGSCEAQ